MADRNEDGAALLEDSSQVKNIPYAIPHLDTHLKEILSNVHEETYLRVLITSKSVMAKN